VVISPRSESLSGSPAPAVDPPPSDSKSSRYQLLFDEDDPDIMPSPSVTAAKDSAVHDLDELLSDLKNNKAS
jgi:hypothetical protein